MYKKCGRLCTILMVMAFMVVTGCGGGGGSNSPAGTGNYSISGTHKLNGAGLSGVTVTISGNSSGSATTGSDGVYSFSGINNGSYIITPTKVGYSFSPTSQVITVSGANVTGKDFVATAVVASSYKVSGTVTSAGSALSGVTITLTGGASLTNTTDSSGYYGFINCPDGANYTITPSKAGYTFSPSSLNVTISGADLAGTNFAATSVSTAGTGTIQLPKTGQSGSSGVAWPVPRFTDNANGTITDNLTGLIWMKNPACFTSNTYTWTAALTYVSTLSSGACGLTDGSTVGQWRLPNVNELESLVDLSTMYPAISNNPFTNPSYFLNGYFWTSTSYAKNPAFAWIVFMANGFSDYRNKTTEPSSVFPVRSAQ